VSLDDLDRSVQLGDLLTRNRDRLSGIRDWNDVARLGRTNLRRLRELVAEDATAELAEMTADERTAWRDAAERLRLIEASSSDDKPCLVRFRAELFRVGAVVRVYGGDTPGSLTRGWIDGRVVDVRKAHRSEWNDGAPNAGYYWQVTIAARLLPTTDELRCSTSEPRVLIEREWRQLADAYQRDPEFFRVFADNARRSWSPIWCLEQGLTSGEADLRAWFAPYSEVSK
jgi:hypothetical protein